jgi:aspartyl-tRNA(Asn)/glutamyl-tRNA(Gln) amidotransferase subunit A
MSMASSLDTTGALTKTVEDMAIVLGTIAGFDPLDATTGKKDVPAYQSELKKSVKGLRLGLPKEYFNAGLQDDVRQGIMAAVKKFEELGASIHEVSLPFTKYAVAAYYVLCPCEVSSNMARYDGIRFGRTMEKPNNLIEYYETIRSEGFGDEVRRRIMIGTFALSAGYFDAYYKKAQQVRTLIKKDFATTFNDVDILLSPVSPSVAFTIGAHANDPIAMYLEDAYAVPQALAGIPSLSLPCGFSRDGLPIGLQMMAPQWHETQLLQAAYAYEQATQEFRGKKPVL